MRLFIGIPLASFVKDALRNVMDWEESGVRWGTPENLHLTLHFLGDCSLAAVRNAISKVTSRTFSLTLRGVGAFEGQDRESILWVNVLQNAELLELHRILAEHLVDAGFSLDRRAYRPHVTLARIKPFVDRNKIRDWLETHRNLSVEPMHVDRYVIYSSDLTKHGPIYTEQESFSLLDA
ncbi:MAG: RNA 2',3'-cyclic phosphodiesterase [Pirellulales bacterium]